MKTFDKIQEEMKKAYEIAEQARAKGLDAETQVEIAKASDLAARTEGLVGPPNCAERIRELIKEHGRDKASLKIIEEIIAGKFGGETEEKRMEQAIRTAITMLTEGILVAGTEGIAKVEINKNPDNSKYLSLFFASPIRSAGGTAAGLAVMVADYARKLIGLDRYKPKEEEIARYVEEIALYNNSISRLQYNPTEGEIKKIISNCPVCIDGEPTSITEVSVYKNLDRVKTNCVRGGMCLVVAEGLAQKAPKLLKFSNKYGIGWNWLESLIKVIKKSGKIEVQPVTKYLKEVVGGRPIFAYPSTPGGFRLRYGRARNTGINSRAIHPASMEILDEFPVIGTQLKIERPKKGCALTPCSNIEPPVVLMKNGDVVKVKDFEEAKKLKKDVKEILFLGDMLVSYGDFLNANHPLIPSGIVEEWWNLIVEKKGIEVPENLSAEEAIGLSKLHNVPLHPNYTYFYNDISKEQLKQLIDWLKTGKREVIGGLFDSKIKRMVLEMNEAKRVLELICFPHKVREGRVIIENSEVLEETLGLSKEIDLNKLIEEKENALEVVNALAGFPVYNKAPVYIGARMGRPEKSKERKMNPAPNGLFPVGNFGGKTRSVEKAAEKGKITLDLPKLVCNKCGKELFSYKCECGGRAVAKNICMNCGKLNEGKTCKYCGGKTIPYYKGIVDLGEVLEKTLRELGEKRAPEKMKGVIGTISDNKFFEPLEKLILRAKNSVWCFKDGTARIDATNLPLTHFKPREIHLTIEEAKKLGYEKDYLGNELVNEEQIVELWPQDVVISETAADYFVRVCNFIDDELVEFYKMNAYYNVKQKEDLIGKLVVGMAPHISAGTLGRIIGFTKARGTYAHPYFHGATRRDCFAFEETVPIYDGKNWKIVKIGEFIEKLIKEEKTRKTDFGDVVIETDKFKTLALDKNNKYVLKKITAFSKHPEQNHVIKLKTANGRTITTSGMHPFIDGEKNIVPAFESKEVITPIKININSKDVEEIDLLNYADKNTMIVGMKKELKSFINKNGLKQTAEKIGIKKATLLNYITRNSVPLEILKKLKIKINKDAKLKTKYDTVIIPRFIKVDKNFLRLLGFYIAEGHYRKKEKRHYQVSFAIIKQKKLVKDTIRKVFGVKAYEADESLTISSRLIANLFEKMGCGRTAKEKRVPSFILSLPNEKVKYFLQGYFEGDGGISKSSAKGSSPEISCTSASKMLLKDMEFLLNRFGIAFSWQKDERTMSKGKVADFYIKRNKVLKWKCYKLRAYGVNAKKFCEEIGFWWPEKNKKAKEIINNHNFNKSREKRIGDAAITKIKEIKIIKKPQPLYNLTVEKEHNVIMSGITTKQCDGDENSLTLLMDALINFSKKYLPSRAGATEDIPLILSTKINPAEVDDQVWDVETINHLPLEFYEAAEKVVNAYDVKIPIIKDKLGKKDEMYNINFMFDTYSIDEGPHQSNYTQLGAMSEKVQRQLELAERIRAVDEKDVAKKIINSHFLRDIYGNLRSFGQQSFRCVDCNAKYRRVPLSGKCTKCGGKLLLTVHRGGIEKYLKVSQEMAKKYGLGDYLEQRLKLIEDDLELIFESEKSKQYSLSSFM